LAACPAGSWRWSRDNKSPKTIKSNLASVRSLTAFLAANDMPGEIDDVTTETIRASLVAERERTTPAFSRQHYRNLSAFWNWLAAEGERAGENPMSQASRRQE
jgi:site-specific recombinase XerD